MANIDLIKRKVFIAAGHGGGDSGAVGQGTTEAAECIDITNKVVAILRADGRLEVDHVPNELGLQGAISYINGRTGHIDDGLAVEIHKNSTVNAHGVETWYPDDPDSRAIAQRIQDKLAAHLGPNRGVKPDTQNRWGRLGFCRDTNIWAMLIEAWFISDGGDPVGSAANDGYARAIAAGILNVFGLTFKPAPAPVPAPTTTWTYQVVSTANNKRLGVYNVRYNAWLKYQAVQGAAKILNSQGADLTAEFSLEFNPPKPDVPNYDPQPEVEDLKKRVGALEAFITLVKAFFPFIK